MKKRIFSLLLCLCMALPLLPTASLAAGTETQGEQSKLAVAMNGKDYMYYDDIVEGWNTAVGDGNTANTTVKLLSNWTATAGSFGTGVGFGETGGLLVPAGKTVTLDLYSFCIDRELTEATKQKQGSVIRVEGALILKDSNAKSSGAITGGYDADCGGVYVAGSGSFTMSGGSITDNHGGGVTVSSGARFAISGAARITGNVFTPRAEVPGDVNYIENVLLYDDAVITVAGELTEGASIGVTSTTKPTGEDPVIVAQGSFPIEGAGGAETLPYTITASDAAKFFSDDSGYESYLWDCSNDGMFVALKAEPTPNGGDSVYPIDITGGNGAVSGSVTLVGGKATIAVDPSAFETVVAKLDFNDTLTFNTAVNKDISEVTITSSLLNSLRLSGCNAKFTLGTGNILVSGGSLDSLIAQNSGNLEFRLADGGAVTVNTADGRALANSAAANFDIGIRVGGTDIKKLDGAVKVELNASSINDLGKAEVYTVDENGMLEYVITYGNGDVPSFYPPHFSPFYIIDFPFEDVPEGAWYHEDAVFAYLSEMLQGTGDTTFSPDCTTTRGMVAAMLYHLEGEPALSGDCPFDDVASGSYCEKAILWAEANGLVDGYGNAKFGPDDPISREQLAQILYCYAQFKGYDVSVGEDTNILSYNDALSISEYAIPAMQWACGAGIINGNAGNLMPQSSADRAQAAAILHRFCNNAAE